MSFQENLRKYRERAGYSQAKEFAEKIGVKYSTYAGYESQGKEPKYATLCKIAEVLGITLDELLGHSSLKEINDALKDTGFSIIERNEENAVLSWEFATDKNPYFKKIVIDNTLFMEIIEHAKERGNIAFRDSIKNELYRFTLIYGNTIPSRTSRPPTDKRNS